MARVQCKRCAPNGPDEEIEGRREDQRWAAGSDALRSRRARALM